MSTYFNHEQSRPCVFLSKSDSSLVFLTIWCGKEEKEKKVVTRLCHKQITVLLLLSFIGDNARGRRLLGHCSWWTTIQQNTIQHRNSIEL